MYSYFLQTRTLHVSFSSSADDQKWTYQQLENIYLFGGSVLMLLSVSLAVAFVG